MDPIRYSGGRRASFALTFYSMTKVTVIAACYGALGGRLLRWYPPQVGAAMAGCGAVTGFFTSRVISNLNMEAWLLNVVDWAGNPQHVPDPRVTHYNKIILACWIAGVFSPLLARFQYSSVGFRTLVRYAVAQMATGLITAPFIWGARKAWGLMGFSPMSLDHGDVELLTRPKWWSGPLHIDPESIRRTLEPPILKEVSELEGVPALSDLYQSWKEANPGVLEKIRISCEKVKNDLQSSVNREFWTLICNVAERIDGLSEPERSRNLKEVGYAFLGCETRQVMALINLLAELDQKVGNTLQEKLQLKICRVNQELKREIFEQICEFVGLNVGDVHAWVGFVSNCHEELGLMKSHINAEEVLMRNNNDNFLLGWMINSVANQFAGKNKNFWIRAVASRYTPELLIKRHLAVWNDDLENLNQVFQFLTEHIQNQLPKGSEKDPLDIVTHYYSIRKNELGVYVLNEEGMILLLKLTGNLVNDDRLHTRLSNQKVLGTAT